MITTDPNRVEVLPHDGDENYYIEEMSDTEYELHMLMNQPPPEDATDFLEEFLEFLQQVSNEPEDYTWDDL